ncbi:hypothetical protein DSM112329_02026 [Paraconexibacter sp. AEG42_29]|uniref:Na+-translocating membrane potential-generating system MpsC domain-containing protein n=1 Tax=Paraconexibacter sp. AEG42_29 TaxID=2997339 RepID=A0AAU7AUK8_9ACTN
MAEPQADAQLVSVTSVIANLVVRVTRDATGRGPTQARAYLNGDLVTVVMQDTLTKGEHTLVDFDRKELVLGTRRAFQEAMGPALIAGVEEATGRTVVAFLSSNSVDPDYSVESFILAPQKAALLV